VNVVMDIPFRGNVSSVIPPEIMSSPEERLYSVK
jgi:hypothetical protein